MSNAKNKENKANKRAHINQRREMFFQKKQKGTFTKTSAFLCGNRRKKQNPRNDVVDDDNDENSNVFASYL